MPHSEVLQIISINVDLKGQETEIKFEHKDFSGKKMGLKFKPADKFGEKNILHTIIYFLLVQKNINILNYLHYIAF